jgi:hypothetical protein
VENPSDDLRQERLRRRASLEDVEATAEGKGSFRFSAERRFLAVGRSDFASFADLTEHVQRVVPSVRSRGGLHGTVTRTGKYERITESGERAFTFGDPILDSITDDRGTITIGQRRHNLYAAEVAHADRSGGISAIDLRAHIPELRQADLLSALTTEGTYTVLECEDDHVVLGSRNPHEMVFYSGSSKMRFRAFKKSYIVYKKMGADVETWGHDFSRASISSSYGQFLGNGLCFSVHTDSDSDTNDDYVDEYEWFLGGGVDSPFDGVSSSCVATWHGRIYSGVVEYGCIVVE